MKSDVTREIVDQPEGWNAQRRGPRIAIKEFVLISKRKKDFGCIGLCDAFVDGCDSGAD